MSLTELFIRRPAFTIVISLIFIIIGLLSYSHLPLRWIPNINLPIVSIFTSYPGASASLVESQISTPIESALAGVNGIESLTSSSKQNVSFVTVTFKLGQNINSAVEDVRSALQSVNSTLPNGANLPSIQKADLNSNPIMYLAISADSRYSDQQISQYVKQFILPRLQTVEGVGSISTFGDREAVMHIWLDPMKMAAANITIDDVTRTLAEQNVQVPSGKIRSETRFFSIVTNETIKSTQEFNELIIRALNNQIVRLKDIGQAEMSADNSDTIFRVNGKIAVALGIVPQSIANPLDVATRVENEFKQAVKMLPIGMEGNIVFNQATFIKASIYHVYQSLFEAILLVLIVIFLFLASWRAAIIPIVTIPICLISTFALMYCFNITINTITLMAFVLAIGLVVDDAIVMLENISRYIDLNMPPFKAAIKGSKEMIFPIIAMTITLAAVYMPIAFTSGILSAVFWDFAMTLCGAVLISGIIALTLSPMMCAKWLPSQKNQNTYGIFLQKFNKQLQYRYGILLTYIFNQKIKMVIGFLFIGLMGFFLYCTLPSELSPNEDMDEVDSFIAAPRDASFNLTDGYAKQLEKIYMKIPEVKTVASEVGFWSPARSSQFVTLTPLEKRKRTASDIAEQINSEIRNTSAVKINVMPAMSPLGQFSGSDGSSIAMRIVSATDFKNLHAITQQFIQALQKYPHFTYVDSALKWDGEQLEVRIDRDKAADMKVSMQDITSTISSLIGGKKVGHFEFDGNLYHIIVQMNHDSLTNPNIISSFYVRNQNNQMVPLQGLVSVTETTSPELLPHFDRLRSDTVHASLAPGYTIADAVKLLQKVAKEILPDGAKYVFEGEAKNYLDSNHKMNITFLLAFLFIYLVLVAQFESFIDPLIILLTVPFAMVGGLFTLKCAGGSLNIYSDIALVTLIGLIAKHGILITEFANQFRSRGKSITEAVIEASKLRLRPILMTTSAMMLGALPLALASGPGAETRHQIGWVIEGGLLFGTFFSLMMVPIAYTFLAKFKNMMTASELADELTSFKEKEIC